MGDTKLPYAAVSHSEPTGRAMGWKGPLWDAINALPSATSMGPDRLRLVGQIELAVQMAMRIAVEAQGDSARIDWLERVLFPLPWGGVYLLAEAEQHDEDTTHVRLSLSPRSGDAEIWAHARESLRASIDAAMDVATAVTPPGAG